MIDRNNPKKTRLSWDEMFMNLAFIASQRAACKFHETGAVFVDTHKRIISIGYNGPTEGDSTVWNAAAPKLTATR